MFSSTIDNIHSLDQDAYDRIEYLVFKKSELNVKINCLGNIDKLCRDHKLIDTLLHDCNLSGDIYDQEMESKILKINIPDILDIDSDTINFTLQLKELYVPIKIKSIFDSLLLMDYLNSNIKLKDNIRTFVGDLLSQNVIDKRIICNENIIHMLALCFKLFGNVHYNIYNNIYDMSFMKKIILIAEHKCTLIDSKLNDSKFIAYLSLIFGERTDITMTLSQIENIQASLRLKHLFGDLLDGLIFDKFFVAGGSINIALDNTIDIDNTSIRTDLDIFLIGTIEEQKKSIIDIITFFVKKFGSDRIYICDIYSIKYLWISDTLYHIQIIGTCFINPCLLVRYFDMTHIKCWYDGINFYKTLGCHVSIESKISYSTALPLKKERIYKTLKRGYKIIPLTYVQNSSVYNKDELSSYDLNDYKSSDVDKYIYINNNFKYLCPKKNCDDISNKINLSFMVNKSYGKIMRLDQLIEINTYKCIEQINNISKENTVLNQEDDIKTVSNFHLNKNITEHLTNNLNKLKEINIDEIAKSIAQKHRRSFNIDTYIFDTDDKFNTNVMYTFNDHKIDAFFNNLDKYIFSDSIEYNQFILMTMNLLKIDEKIFDEIKINDESYCDITGEFPKSPSSVFRADILSLDAKIIRIDFGKFMLSNVIAHKTQSRNWIKIALLVKEQKYNIYLIMLKIYKSIEKMNKYDMKNLNLNNTFPNSPHVFNNKYNKYIGDYLICTTNIDKFCNNNYKIGNLIQCTLSFSIIFHKIDKVKRIIRINPILSIE